MSTILHDALRYEQNDFFYLGFYVTVNTAQIISQRVVLWAEETSTYSWSRFCTVNCRPSGRKYQLSPHKVLGLNCRPPRWEASVLPLLHLDKMKGNSEKDFKNHTKQKRVLAIVTGFLRCILTIPTHVITV